jgi:glycosyltransferase involved in cell wall biosynthesis
MLLSSLKTLARHGLAAYWAGLGHLGLAGSKGPPVAYVVERGAHWTIRWVGNSYADAINKLRPGTIEVVDYPERLTHRIAHFGSQFVWELWTKALPASNRQVTTYFHGKPEDGPDMARHIAFFLANHHRLDRIVTAAGLVEQRLLSWGIPQEKLVRVPLGIDPVLFHPPSPQERLAARTHFAVPEHSLCIGSFQKDGVGWGDGMEPKLIKGPDLFVEAAARLAKRFPLFVLLTGPARGYVKAGLERHKIPYRHVYLDDYRDMARAYHALDLYLMTSREEGGPMSLLESSASGVPIVSTKAGMAPDLFADGGPCLVETGDLDGLSQKAECLLSDSILRQSVIEAGLGLACDYSWDKVGALHFDHVYAPLMKLGPK